jgi:hypothetical protein
MKVRMNSTLGKVTASLKSNTNMEVMCTFEVGAKPEALNIALVMALLL